MDYEIYSINQDNHWSCHLDCKASEVDEKLKWLQEKYPHIKTWIFGLDVHIRQVE